MTQPEIIVSVLCIASVIATLVIWAALAAAKRGEKGADQ